MKLQSRQHLVAMIFPASMLDIVRQQTQDGTKKGSGPVFLTGDQPVAIRRVRLIAEEFARNGKTVRVVRTL